MPDERGESLRAERARIEAALSRLCDGALSAVTPRVASAIRYSLLGEGKRLRALLVAAAYRAAGGDRDISALAAAVEVVHAYSLIHDDLPCMDDDDMRRGRPTVHKVFGVDAAIAAGVTMVPLAADAAYRAARELGLDRDEAAAIVRELMRASGAGGMIGGQLLDLLAEGEQLELSELERVHRAKTGALIAASVRLGAMAARAPAESLRALDAYGDAIGLAFQIADDVLDVTATTVQLGKTAGRDVALQKSTYPALLGVTGAMNRALSLTSEACRHLDGTTLRTPELEELARYIVERRS